MELATPAVDLELAQEPFGLAGGPVMVELAKAAMEQVAAVMDW